jgi:short-subunit dehydrogenase
MINYRNAWALVTGASSGIGMEFAWQLAKRGTNLILVARRANLLDALAGQVQETHGVRAVAIAADLALPDAPQALFNQVRALGVPVHILVNNAGVGVYGRLDETKLEDNQRMIMLNIQALLGLTHLFLPARAVYST